MDSIDIARYLRRNHIHIVGGEFTDSALPNALHEEGIKIIYVVGLFQGEQYWKEHPESKTITASGERLKPEGWYYAVCPTQIWLQEKKLAEIDSILATGCYDTVYLFLNNL